MELTETEVEIQTALIHYLDGKVKDWDYEEADLMLSDLSLLLRLYKPKVEISPYQASRYYHRFFQRSLPGLLPDWFIETPIPETLKPYQLAVILSELTGEWHSAMIDTGQFRQIAKRPVDPHLKELLI